MGPGGGPLHIHLPQPQVQVQPQARDQPHPDAKEQPNTMEIVAFYASLPPPWHQPPDVSVALAGDVVKLVTAKDGGILFDGTRKSWFPFSDDFMHSVHRVKLPIITKVRILKRILASACEKNPTGELAQTLRALTNPPGTPQVQYRAILMTLEQYYGRLEAYLQELIKELSTMRVRRLNLGDIMLLQNALETYLAAARRQYGQYFDPTQLMKEHGDIFSNLSADMQNGYSGYLVHQGITRADISHLNDFLKQQQMLLSSLALPNHQSGPTRNGFGNGNGRGGMGGARGWRQRIHMVDAASGEEVSYTLDEGNNDFVDEPEENDDWSIDAGEDDNGKLTFRINRRPNNDNRRKTDNPPRISNTSGTPPVLGNNGPAFDKSGTGGSTRKGKIIENPPRGQRCPCGNPSHLYLNECLRFKQMTVVERRRWIGKHKYAFCYRCLKPGHVAKDCKFKGKPCRRCDLPHHTWLHDENYVQNKSEIKTFTVLDGIDGGQGQEEDLDALGESFDIVPGPDDDDDEVQTYFNQQSFSTLVGRAARKTKNYEGRTAVCVTPVYINGQYENALIDDGSTGTLMDDLLAQELGLEGIPIRTVMSGLSNRMTLSTKQVEFTLQNHDKTYECFIRASVVPNICGDLKPLDWAKLQQDLPHLAKAKFPKPDYKKPVRLIIGQDLPEILQPIAVIKAPSPGLPYAIKNVLGWTAMGPVPSRSDGTYDIGFNRVMLINKLQEQSDRLDDAEMTMHTAETPSLPHPSWGILGHSLISRAPKEEVVRERLALENFQSTYDVDEQIKRNLQDDLMGALPMEEIMRRAIMRDSMPGDTFDKRAPSLHDEKAIKILEQGVTKLPSGKYQCPLLLNTKNGEDSQDAGQLPIRLGQVFQG